MANHWQGNNWTAGNWDDNNWRGPNGESASGVVNLSATIGGTGSITASVTDPNAVAQETVRPGGTARRSRSRRMVLPPKPQIVQIAATLSGAGGIDSDGVADRTPFENDESEFFMLLAA